MNLYANAREVRIFIRLSSVPRGIGKTSLLLRVAAEVRRDDSLSSRFFPIVFAEESYEVSTAGEFWLECLFQLAEQIPFRPNSPDLKRSYEELRQIRDDRMLGDRCLGVLQDFADREDKRLATDSREPEHDVQGYC